MRRPDDLSKLTDGELVKLSRRDARAFHELYGRYAKTIDAWVRRRCNDDDLAIEITAETFAQAWFNRRKFRDTGDASGIRWLYGIARNLLSSHFRSEASEKSATRKLEMLVTSAATHPIDTPVEKADVELAVDRLPEHQRQALELRVVDDLTFAQIAGRLDCSENAAKLRVSRALAALRSDIEAGSDQPLERMT